MEVCVIYSARTTTNPKKMSRRKRSEILVKRLARHLGLKIQLDSSVIGRKFELKVARVCRDTGFQVIDCSAKKLPYDLLVNGKKVQCKVRHLGKRRRDGDGIHLSKGKGKDRYRVCDIDFFVIGSKGVIWVIPTSLLSTDSGYVKSWVSLKNKSHFISAFEQLAGLPVSYDRQVRFGFKEATDGR